MFFEGFPLLISARLYSAFEGDMRPSNNVSVETNAALSKDVLAKFVYLVHLFLIAG